jgi:pyruvate dehydrogenase E2 component (dihydrolipoamide acetyltransferase)
MPVEFKLPELGENVEKGDVVRVLVNVGDVIKAEQAVLELETDKATIEVPATEGGTVSEVRVKAGDKVKVGQVVLVFDAAAAKAKAAAPAKAAVAAPSPAAAQPDPEAEPAAPVTPAPESKPASKHAASVVLMSKARPGPIAVETPAQADAASGSVAAAPSVRRYARELGVEIGDVAGTGPGGRIGQDDVTRHVKGAMAAAGARAAGPSAGVGAGRVPALPDFSKWGEVESRPMSSIRRTTAEHLTAAWQAPHVTQHDKADVTALEEFRKAYGARVEAGGGKLTVTAILIKIVATAIGRFPQFASSVDMANEAIIYKKYCHIGIAVDTPAGLLVPVVRDADKKGIAEVSAELATLSQKARDRKLSREEMSGGVFSITNLGGIGGTSFTPIVNRPEVAILGVSRTALEPVWKDDPSAGPGAGRFVPRQMLPLSLSYDHRVIDGADAARFLRFVADALEQPLSMYL